RGTYHKAFIQVGNLWELSDTVRKFVFARRFAKIAADLMGVDGVRVYHDQALFKEPGGGPTPWHQDQFYWPIDTDKTITMWMPLCDCPLEMGSLVFASGQHKQGAFAQIAISDESARLYSEFAKKNEWRLGIYELGMGDATFHAGWTPHKAPGNSTDKMRPAMTIIYHAHDARITEPANESQPMDLERWFPGLKPGDPCASPLNPILWHKDESLIGTV
ncbi:MAG: phytanoyl-CoA dioxygenase family protein, partial [Candidatus Sumerlaeia bacterium]|nr:phytanoyl-CoA dioxygenase family protein [Candidatus Sumerlaeia bacterium]